MDRSSEPWILAATIIGSSLVFIDGTAVNVALPVLQKDIGATIGQTQWVVEGYTLFLAALMLVGGTLGDRYGRRRIYALGLALFALASVWCSAAPDVAQLITARSLQGIAGALLVPGSLAIITASFPKERRGRAIGTWSGLSALTTALGPLLGGWLIDTISWRAVFIINVIPAALVLAILFRHVPESRNDQAANRLDYAGILTVTPGLGLLVYGLIEWNNGTLADTAVLVPLLVSLPLLIGFLFIEARTTSPMMPLRFFRSPTFAGANLLTFLIYAALSALMFFLSFNLIQVHGYSATEAGAALLPFIILISLLSRWSGGLVSTVGARLPLIVGPIITAVSYFLFSLPGTDGSYWSTFFPAATVMGLGMAVSVAPLTTVVMNAVEERHAGIASGINNAVSRLAGLVAIAVLGVVTVNTFSAELEERLTAMQLDPEIRQEMLRQRSSMAAMPIPEELSSDQREDLRAAVNDSFVEGFRLMAILCGALTLLGSLCALLLIEKTEADPPSS